MPYMTKYDKVLTKQLTVGEVLAHIEEDLLASIELLNNSDPYGLAPKSDDYDLHLHFVCNSLIIIQS